MRSKIPQSSGTSGEPPRAPSLLERAATVYDFNQHVRARPPVPPVEPARVPEPAAEPVAAFEADAPDSDDATFLAIPAELRAPIGQELPDEFHLPFVASDTAMIDRGMLAANGMMVPGAPVGPLAEEFRLIKRQLLITRAQIEASAVPDKARTILVCSARPNDGKTFCAINLALSIAAERDTEVLLVDADVAKPDGS
jgi:hypothetical protein